MAKEKVIRTSAKYYDSLNEPSKKALELAYTYGLQYTKRIISLTNRHFKNFENIIPLSRYYTPKDNMESLAINTAFVIVKDNDIIGIVCKSRMGKGGITERVSRRDGDNYVEVWNNYNGRH